MERILFRGQTRKYGSKVTLSGKKLPGIWVYGGVFAPHGDTEEYAHAIIYTYDRDVEKFAVHADTVGQFVGIPDCNGKDIFEDDIVALYVKADPCDGIQANRTGIPNIVGKVCFAGGKFGVQYTDKASQRRFDCFDTSKYRYEVIGNIFDNPDIAQTL